MILYTNGCSFTQGHEDHRILSSESGLKKDDKILDSEWAWPQLLKDHFSNVVNEAWCGGSNDRIFRRTLEYAQSLDDVSDHLFIIQCTNVTRSEFYDVDTGVWIGKLYDQIVYDDMSYSADIDKSLIKKLSRGNREFEHLQLTNETTYTKFFNNLVSFDYVMSRLGCKVFYTGLSLSCTPFMLKELLGHYVNEPIHYLQNPNLQKIYPASSKLEFPKTNTTVGLNMQVAKNHLLLLESIPNLDDRCFHPIAKIVKGHTVSKDDTHPNKTGHRLFARYIINELKSRDIL